MKWGVSDERGKKREEHEKERKRRSVSDRGRPGNIRYLFLLLLLLLPGKGGNQQILLFSPLPFYPQVKFYFDPCKNVSPFIILSNRVMSALIGWLDETLAFQYEVVRHKSLHCRGGGRGQEGAESHGNSILSYPYSPVT